ncbi:hypothetical protein SERLADRAFT_436356 [Serpula lacrymans var. lacrymans S7.9]|uniref:Aminoglycoside phosphotransferase domain-containing protein n=1 Tax=Serpula lacrymans var. lacrymans (strain S7.9) TaxID=578457 RepID=F8NQ81_SERL9|nr:uncharacterized protein SERLADRAFT_436356 [Serpula lacrymans var. lacrymans S7.9]EGO26541.1 hypothetical protein SERLADRAFT_436356 [Serpula lacrymans var. lacrymans S7.9]
MVSFWPPFEDWPSRHRSRSSHSTFYSSAYLDTSSTSTGLSNLRKRCLHSYAESAEYVRQLRLLSRPPQVPPGAVCSLRGAPFLDSRISGNQPLGPYPSESTFNDRLVIAANPFMDEGLTTPIRARMRNDHPIVFTHGDLAPRNIMMRGSEIVAIVDWEESGWMPEHWELVKLMWCTGMEKNSGWAQLMLDKFAHEEESWKIDKELSDIMVGAF